MIYAQTARLILRQLRRDDLPRLVTLIGDWEVAGRLAVVPYPYSLADAEAFYQRVEAAAQEGKPPFCLMQEKGGRLIGGVGLHLSREPEPQQGEVVLGYWLGKPYWGRGLMSEAVGPVLGLAFARPEVTLLTATTDPANEASQNVLRKAGLHCLGLAPRRDHAALRGGSTVVNWQMTRADYVNRDALAQSPKPG
jgi:RimJ/RimL family protein N-acetyltransferase